MAEKHSRRIARDIFRRTKSGPAADGASPLSRRPAAAVLRGDAINRVVQLSVCLSLAAAVGVAAWPSLSGDLAFARSASKPGIDGASLRPIGGRFGPDGGLTLVGIRGDFSRVELRDAATGRLCGPAVVTRSIAWTADGTSAVTGHADGSVRVWPSGDFGGAATSFNVHTVAVDDATAVPGRGGVSCGVDGTVCRWETDGTVRWRRKVEAASGARLPTQCLTVSPAGGTVAVRDGDGMVRLLRLEDGRGTVTLGDGADAVRSLACSPDGRRLIVGHFDGSVSCREAGSGEVLWREVQTDPGPQSVLAVAVSPDGCFAAAGWGLTTPVDYRRLLDDPASYPACWSSVRLWDVDTGRFAGVLETETPVIAVEFLPDGMLGVILRNGTAASWNLLDRSEVRWTERANWWWGAPEDDGVSPGGENDSGSREA